MPSKLKILCIGPQNVIPAIDGGKESIYGAISSIAKYAEVSYAFPCDSPSREITKGYLDVGVSPLPCNFRPVENLKILFHSLLLFRPFKFEKYCTAKAINALDAVVPAGALYDVIICHHAHTVRLAESICIRRRWKVPIVLREHNVEYCLVDSYVQSLKGIKFIVGQLFVWLTRREEHSIWRRVNLVAFLSDNDLKIAQSSKTQGVFILAPEGTSIPPSRYPSHPNPSSPLLVLLNPRATQSVKNLKDFLLSIWLPLKNKGRLANCKLHVTGITTTQLGQLVSIKPHLLEASNISGLGFLPNLSGTFASSLALVSPTFVGGGIRKKILEAMANELPVIATDLDISTCDYFIPESNILTMKSTSDFELNVESLQYNPERWVSLSRSARKTIEQFAGWECYAEKIISEIMGLKCSTKMF